eukprot:11756157-Ditylum_brightwellii.AAC.1
MGLILGLGLGLGLGSDAVQTWFLFWVRNQAFDRDRFLVWDTVSVLDTVFTSGSTQEIKSGFDLSLGHGLGSNK